MPEQAKGIPSQLATARRRPPQALRAALVLVVSITATACSTVLEHQTIAYPDAGPITPRPDDCAVEMIDSSETEREGCVALGDVFVGDTGTSIACERPRVLDEARADLCRLGATHAHYRQMQDPNLSCYQVRAVGLRCDAATGAAR